MDAKRIGKWAAAVIAAAALTFGAVAASAGGGAAGTAGMHLHGHPSGHVLAVPDMHYHG